MEIFNLIICIISCQVQCTQFSDEKFGQGVMKLESFICPLFLSIKNKSEKSSQDSRVRRPWVHLCPWAYWSLNCLQFSSVQLLSPVWLFVTPWTAAHQVSLPITNSQNLLRLMSIELMVPSNNLILCRPLLLSPSIFPSIRDFSNELALCIRWPQYWSSSFNISPSNEYSGLIYFRMN